MALEWLLSLFPVIFMATQGKWSSNRREASIWQIPCWTESHIEYGTRANKHLSRTFLGRLSCRLLLRNSRFYSALSLQTLYHQAANSPPVQSSSSNRTPLKATNLLMINKLKDLKDMIFLKFGWTNEVTEEFSPIISSISLIPIFRKNWLEFFILRFYR